MHGSQREEARLWPESAVNPVGYHSRFAAMFLGLAKHFRETGDLEGCRLALGSARRNVQKLRRALA